MGSLLVFNPEQEYSLASSSPWYQPPASIVRLSEKLRFLPLYWGKEGDYILDRNETFYLITTSGVDKVDFKETLPSFERIEPWGWNQALLKRFQKLRVKSGLLPDKVFIENVRRLSHRRISIEMNRYLHSPSIPQEFFALEEALAYWEENRGCYFKLPWSSGGRGVVDTGELNYCQVSKWISGAIKKQGSVLAEPAILCTIQFASLWNLQNDKVVFNGFSITESDGRGKYKGNITGPPDEINRIITEHCEIEIEILLKKQKLFMEEKILPCYHGPIGIDMMADHHGTIYPCVEINLRRTMGHVALAYSKMTEQEKHKIMQYCHAPLIENAPDNYR